VQAALALLAGAMRGSLQASRRVTEGTSAKWRKQGRCRLASSDLGRSAELNRNLVRKRTHARNVELDEYGCIEIERMPRVPEASGPW